MSQRRDSILREIGLGPLWRLRDRPEAGDAPAAESEAPAEPDTSAVATRPAATPLPVAATSVPLSCLDEGRATRIAALDWAELKTAVAACQDCALGRGRKQAVLGVGDVEADWLFVGEGPGAEEDERGEPFVGQAGKLLDAMLAAIDLRRGDNVYIANVGEVPPPQQSHARGGGNGRLLALSGTADRPAQAEADRRAGATGGSDAAAQRSEDFVERAVACSSSTASL